MDETGPFSAPVLNFDFSHCDEVVVDGVLHAIPKNDSAKHTPENCQCGYQEVKIGDTVIAVVHKSWDKRELIDTLYETDSVANANDLRKEYMEMSKKMLQEGKIDNQTYFNKWFLFEDTFETLFRAN
jgi:hypothetical protein